MSDTIYTAAGEPWKSIAEKLEKIENDTMAMVHSGAFTKPDAREWLAQHLGSIERDYEELLSRANELKAPVQEV